MHSIVTASDVTFEFANGRVLFNNLNFSLDSKLTALVGPNGVGKSTLAKLLVGDELPSEGKITRNKVISFFPQRKTPPAITIDEYLSIHYSWSLLGEKLLEGINRQDLCNQLSGGQWMRVRLTLALKEQYLILDEPTNDLDREGRSALLNFLTENKNGILLISHDRECLELCETVLELSNQGLTKYGSGWSSYEQTKSQERENLSSFLETAKRDRQKAHSERHLEIVKQEKRNQRGKMAAAKGGMPKILIGARKRRAQVTTGKVDVSTFAKANDAVRNAFEAFNELKLDPLMYAEILGQEIPAQKLVAEAIDFNVRYHNWTFKKDISFIWRGNIRIALKGQNGSGKSTLLKAIQGEKLETRGNLRKGNLTTLFLDQQCATLNDDLNVLENVQESSYLDEAEIRNGLAKFLFTKDTIFQKVSSLSGGERLRAALAKGLLSTEKPELLILDEPTNNLDLANIKFLESLICEFMGALIVISHDEVFLKNCKITEEFKI